MKRIRYPGHAIMSQRKVLGRKMKHLSFCQTKEWQDREGALSRTDPRI